VKVGEVRDPQAVELFGQPGQLEIEHPPAQPAGFEQAPTQASRSSPTEGLQT
jgi:hypothetical protein